MAQVIEELVVKITGDTGDVESKIKQLGKSQQATSQELAASQVQAARESVFGIEAAGKAGAAQRRFAAAEARRDVRAELANIKDALTDAQQISAGFADKLFGIDEDRIRATRLAGSIANINGLLETGTNFTDEQRQALKTYRDAAATELDQIKSRWEGVGGAIRGTAATAVRSLASGLVIGATIGVVTTAFEAFGDTVVKSFDRVANQSKFAAASFDRLGNTVRGLGGADRFGGLANLGPQLRSLAESAERIGNQKAAYEALIALFGAAGAAGTTGLTPEEIALRARAKSGREEFLENIGLGNVFSSVFTGFTAGIEGIFGGDRIRDAFEQLGPEAVALFDKALAESNGINKYADAAGQAAEEFFKIKGAVIEANLEFQRQDSIAQGLLGTLRSGGVLQKEQLDLLKSITTEQQRQVLLSFAGRDAQRGLANASQEVLDIEADIAILRGELSSDANKNALKAIEDARSRLDARERAIDERAFREQRRQALADLEANLRRAGIRQAGQTSFDVFAAQREAEAQAQRERRGFRDEDERRAIRAARAELDAKESTIRRSIELTALQARLAIAKDNEVFANLRVEIFNTSAEAAKALGLVYTTGLAAVTGLAGAALATGAALAGSGRTPFSPIPRATGGSAIAGVPYLVGEVGPELFVPNESGLIMPNTMLRAPSQTTIILQSAPIILDGEVVGRAIERRVTARSNRRAALGVA